MTQLIRPIELAHNKPIIALLALATHYILHNGEWDNAFHIILGVWTLAFGGMYMYDVQAKTVGAVIQVTATAAALYFGTLATSILLHRGFFHRLRRVAPSHLVDAT